MKEKNITGKGNIYIKAVDQLLKNLVWKLKNKSHTINCNYNKYIKNVKYDVKNKTLGGK